MRIDHGTFNNNSIGRGLVVFVFMISIILSPVIVFELYDNIEVIIFWCQYEKKRIKIDSVDVKESSPPSDGQGLGATYYLYNFKQNIKVTIKDNNHSIWKFFGEENKAFHAMEYMKNHSDSIWVWYNPNAEARYTKEEETYFPVINYVAYAIIDGLIVGLAIYGIQWQVRDYKKRRKKTD